MQLPLPLPLLLTLPLPLLLTLGSPSVYRRVGGARSGKRCGVCLSQALLGEFSRAPLRVPTAREPRAAGRHSRGRLFWLLFWRSKKVTRPPGRTPGLVMMLGHACWVIRRDDVTAKQQLLLNLKLCSVCRQHCKGNCYDAAWRCQVTQCDCTAVETSRDSVPAAGSLFLLRQKK